MANCVRSLPKPTVGGIQVLILLSVLSISTISFDCMGFSPSGWSDCRLAAELLRSSTVARLEEQTDVGPGSAISNRLNIFAESNHRCRTSQILQLEGIPPLWASYCEPHAVHIGSCDAMMPAPFQIQSPGTRWITQALTMVPALVELLC